MKRWMAAVTMEGQFHTCVRARALNSLDSVAFIRRLKARWPARKLLVIWDDLPLHRFKAVRAFQDTLRLPGTSSSSDCLAMLPTSTRWTAGCGTTSSMSPWPTSAARTSANSKGNSPAPSSLYAPNLASSKLASAR